MNHDHQHPVVQVQE